MRNILILMAIVFFGSSVWALSAKEIMLKNEDVKKLRDVTSNAKLVTGGGGKPERTKDFSWWRKISSDKVHFKTLTRFHAPAEVKNEGILFLEASGDQAEVLIYLPSYKKIRRVESGQQSGSFMGSEFSYSDIAAPHVEDFDYKLLREESCPDYAGVGLKCSVIEYSPNKDSILDRTGSAKGIIWIRQDNFMDVKIEVYDLDKKLWKIMEATETAEISSKDHKWMSEHLKMENIKTKRYTIFTFRNVKANQDVSDAIFTQQNLSKED